MLLEVIEADQEIAIACLEGVTSVELLNPFHILDIDLLTLDLVSNSVVEGSDGREGGEHPLEIYESGRRGVAGSVSQKG